MSTRTTALGAFLRARRALLRPEDVGFPRDLARRVEGLRREEVAHLAGISLEYYVRLEQGRNHQLSEQVLSSLARALRLDEDATTYFYRLALPSPISLIGAAIRKPVSPIIRALVRQWSGTPAYVFDRNQDVLFANDLATALSPGYVVPGNNLVSSLFSASAEGRSNLLWRETARASVAALRFQGDPSDPRLQEIVGALSMQDSDFRQLWARHEASPLSGGTTPNHVEGFGRVNVRWQVLDVPEGNFMNVNVADVGSPAAAAIDFLARGLRVNDAETAGQLVS